MVYLWPLPSTVQHQLFLLRLLHLLGEFHLEHDRSQHNRRAPQNLRCVAAKIDKLVHSFHADHGKVCHSIGHVPHRLGGHTGKRRSSDVFVRFTILDVFVVTVFCGFEDFADNVGATSGCVLGAGITPIGSDSSFCADPLTENTQEKRTNLSHSTFSKYYSYRCCFALLSIVADRLYSAVY